MLRGLERQPGGFLPCFRVVLPRVVFKGLNVILFKAVLWFLPFLGENWLCIAMGAIVGQGFFRVHFP